MEGGPYSFVGATSIDMGIESDISTGARLLAGLGTISDGFGITSREAEAMSWSTRKCIADYCRKPAKNTVPDNLYYKEIKLTGPVCPAHHQMLRRHFQIDRNNPHVKCRDGRCAKKCAESLDAMLNGMQMAAAEATRRTERIRAAAAPAAAPAPAPAASRARRAAAAPAAAPAPSAAYGAPMAAHSGSTAGGVLPSAASFGVGDMSMSLDLPGSGSIGLSSAAMLGGMGSSVAGSGAASGADGAGDVDMGEASDSDDDAKFAGLMWGSGGGTAAPAGTRRSSRR